MFLIYSFYAQEDIRIELSGLRIINISCVHEIIRCVHEIIRCVHEIFS